MTDAVQDPIALAAAVLELFGAFLFFSSAVGLLRLPDFYSRVHAPTKAATLGVVFLALSSLLRSLPRGDWVWLEDLGIAVFLFLTMPVSSQMLMRAAVVCGVPATRRTQGDPTPIRSKGHDDGGGRDPGSGASNAPK
jgi:multicomponent K+:H+ antiporter subunit G